MRPYRWYILYMTSEAETDRTSRIFKASNFWESNVWGAVIAGIGAGLLMSVIGGILLFESAGPSGKRAGAILILTMVATLLAMFPGNLLAATPIAVEVEDGKGLHLCAPLKKLYIPVDELEEVRDSTVFQVFQGGTVVRLNRRHGLMKSFLIHWLFGDDGKELARVLQREINKR